MSFYDCGSFTTFKKDYSLHYCRNLNGVQMLVAHMLSMNPKCSIHIRESKKKFKTKYGYEVNTYYKVAVLHRGECKIEIL